MKVDVYPLDPNKLPAAARVVDGDITVEVRVDHGSVSLRIHDLRTGRYVTIDRDENDPLVRLVAMVDLATNRLLARTVSIIAKERRSTMNAKPKPKPRPRPKPCTKPRSKS